GAGAQGGDAMQVGDVKLEVVGPLEFASSGGNDDSLCLLGTAPARRADGWRFLLTGDAEAQPLAKALAAFDVGNLDLVKVGHHGSKNALSAPILEATAPEVGLISVGEGNSYGHPHPSTLQLLEEAGAQVLRTDVCGDVTASFSPQRIELRIQQAGGPE
ncbi:ComEC/Rec2 family competence protein, partial [Parvibacter caecicola]|uniref:ComEC/Rec2 family competence protein n=1 Tax=Parvibacter caecicola TaxID=747645 RepID=UPI0034E3CA79